MLRGLLSVAVFSVFPAVALAQQPCTTDSARVVDELYRHMLERPADPSSAGWAEKLQNGSATVRDLVRNIAKSPEHAERFYNPGRGGAAQSRAVGTLYRHLLGRQPDQAGLNVYTTTAAKDGLGPVIDAIVDSGEYTQTYGDWGVPGSAGVRYCAPGEAAAQAASSAQMKWANLDTNHDGTIARTEWRGNARSFNIRDWNGDGVLSGDEVKAGAMAPSASVEARDFTMTNDDRFAYLDVNNNSTVDQNEWDGSLDTFYRMDKNRDNKLSRAEMGVAVGNPFTSVDANRDGRITLNEWPYSHRSFDDQDVNGDGVVSRQEFKGGTAPTTGR